jgi:hypothetical protein
MWAESKHALRRLRGRIIGWSIGLGLYSLLMLFMYDAVLEIMGIEELLAAYPPEVMAFIGVTDIFAIMTPLYYYQGGQATGGLNWGWLAGVMAVTLLLAAAAWFLFNSGISALAVRTAGRFPAGAGYRPG